MTTTSEPDQVAEVLARVAREHRFHATPIPVAPRCHCGWRPFGMDEHDHRVHLAETQAAALRAAGLVVEGTEVEEWGVRFDLTDGHVDLTPRSVVEKIEPGHGVTGVRRTRTRYPDRMTEWVAVDEEQP